MPASAGRVRMPHNNRLSTSGALKTSDIWSKTIGHDPYAAEGEKQEAGASAADEAKARGLMELARHQNVAGRDASRDDFARKMFLGLKPGKQRREAATKSTEDGKMYELLEQETSSSEDEFVEVEGTAEKRSKESSKKSKKKDRKRKDRKRRRKRRSSSFSSDDGSSSDDSSRHERRRKRHREKRKRKKKHRRRQESDSDDSESSDSEREHRRKSTHRRREKDDRKRRRTEDSRESHLEGDKKHCDRKGDGDDEKHNHYEKDGSRVRESEECKR